MFHLEFPNIPHKSRYIAMIEEWRAFETTPTSPGALFRGETFEEFLEITKENINANSFGVPATLFFFMEDEEIIGAIQVRHHIDHPRLSLDGKGHGHIGYGLRPSARGKGFAKEMLQLGLIEAKKMGIEKILISAHEENPASWKTIERFSGKHVRTIDDAGKNLRVYWIESV